MRTPRAKQQLQVDRLKKFKKKNAGKAEKALWRNWPRSWRAARIVSRP